MFLKRMLTTRNVGPIDRVVRVLPAIVVAILWAQGLISGVAAAALAVVAGMLLVTALTGSCSIYYMLGWSTCPAGSAPRD